MTAEERLIATMPLPVESLFFDVAGKKLHAVMAGSGPTVVLLHGLNIGWGQWYAMIPEIAKTRRVIAIDLTGSGAADKIDYLSVDIAQATVTAVDEALKVLAPSGALVVGHSIGGWAALKLAARNHPSISAVMAVDAVGFTDFIPFGYRPVALRPLVRLIASTVMRPTRSNMKSFLGDVMIDPTSMSPEFVDYFFEHVTRPPASHPLFLIHGMFRPFRMRQEFVLSSTELSSIACPVTLVHGADDPLIPIGRVRSKFGKIRQAKVVVMDGVGHVPPIESPDELTRLITEAFAT